MSLFTQPVALVSLRLPLAGSDSSVGTMETPSPLAFASQRSARLLSSHCRVCSAVAASGVVPEAVATAAGLSTACAGTASGANVRLAATAAAGRAVRTQRREEMDIRKYPPLVVVSLANLNRGGGVPRSRFVVSYLRQYCSRLRSLSSISDVGVSSRLCAYTSEERPVTR